MNSPIVIASILVLFFMTPFQWEEKDAVPPIVDPTHYCAHDWLQKDAYEKNPELVQRQKKLEEQAYQFLQNNNQESATLADYTLPIVVHIIHNNGDENITDSQVLDGIQHLNDAYANVGYYDPATGVDTKFQFCLAKRDPDGNATSGITRTQSTLTSFTMESEDVALKDLSRWDPTQYINVWVTREICSSSIGCGVAGYAYFPASHGDDNDGIVLEAEWMGSSPGNSSVLAHEMGHYLGLYHTFQGGCTNNDCLADGDRVCDTPPDQSTAPVPCTGTMNSCMTDVNTGDVNNPFTTDQNDMFINFMDYGDWDCYSAFTLGQANRMSYFINEVRNSLLESDACKDPCLSMVTAVFVSTATVVDLQGTLNFNNLSANATDFQWFVNGQLFSNGMNASYTFNSLGVFEIMLLANNGNPNCEQSQTMLIEVICPVQAGFTMSASPPFELGQQITFNNSSVNSNNFNWKVDGIVASQGTNYTTTFNTLGVVEICLEANGICGDTVCQQVAIIPTLDCFNDIDDDGDGLVGCYDPDCCESTFCADNYYNECPIDCEYDPPLADFSLELEWSTTGGGENWCAYNTPITGDIDGDGTPEIIGKPCTGTSQSPSAAYPNLLIVDGSSGIIENIIPTPGLKYLMDGPALADVDLDGYGEIFVQASSHFSNQNYSAGGVITGDVRRRILCYSYDGSQYVEKWMSEIPAGYDNAEEANTINITDFNQDGIAEVYVQNMIFNALDGSLIVAGGTNTHRGMKTFQGSLTLLRASSYAVAVDVLPDNACVNCGGLELVAGGMVYSVKIDPVSPELKVEVTLPGVEDGWTSIADVDHDGDLDAVVTSNTATGALGLIYIWDLQTPNLLYPIYNLPTSSGYIALSNIADFNGDGFVELGVCTPFNYQVIKPVGGALTVMWSLVTDDWSGQTGSTVFDFNNDGANEVVYRSETEIQILSGVTGLLLTSAPCTSGTRVEYPVVVDVDADGETEILCSCTNELKAFGSAGSPWVSTRRVWNQHLYFNVNINDDLTIPIQQQTHHIVGDSVVLNNFLTQYANIQFPVPNAAVEAIHFDCTSNGSSLEVEICNEGDLVLSQETPISFYDADPTQGTANLIDLKPLSDNLEPGECKMYVFDLPLVNTDEIFIVVNDNNTLSPPYNLGTDFPITAIPECDYLNNISSQSATGSLPALDLGPDIMVCDNGTFTFVANAGFDTYQWQDFSYDPSFTAFGPGTYWVTASIGCTEVSDTVTITIDPATVMDLGPDLILCTGDSLLLTASGFDHYQWFPEGLLSCDTCETVVIAIPENRTYTVVGNTDLGCYSTDSIRISVGENTESTFTTTICQGETYLFDGVEIPAGSQQTFVYDSFLGCDSSILVDILASAFSASFVQIDTFICEGSSIIFDNVVIPADSVVTFYYETVNECDSIIVINTIPLDTFLVTEERTLCAGDSTLVFGQFEHTSGLYTTIYLSTEGCDSTAQVQVTVLEPLASNLEFTPSCIDDSTGVIATQVTGGMPPYTYDWSIENENDPTLSDLPGGIYSLTISDAINCQKVETLVLEYTLPLSVTAESFDVTCFGYEDGALLIDSVYQGLQFSLDGEFFQTGLAFQNMPAGAYTLYIQDEQGCIFTQEEQIVEPQKLVVSLPPDSTILLGCELNLDTWVNSFDSIIYQWSPPVGLACLDCPETMAKPVYTTRYFVQVIDEAGCEAMDEVLITVEKPRDLYIPNVFSPNADGVNDVFTLYGGKGVEEVLSLRIFNRWGALVYEFENFPPDEEEYGWDGFFKEQRMGPDVFVYLALVKFTDGFVIQYSGDVTLLK